MASSSSEDEQVPASSAFATLSLDDSSDDSETEPPSPKPAAPPPRKPKEDKKQDDEDEDALLAAAIEEASSEAAASLSQSGPQDGYLRADLGKVDAEREVSTRLGSRLERSRREKRRGLFPASFDGDFGDPPSFGKGGIRFDETGKAIPSDDWIEGNRELEACPGDPNELASLCAVRPFHAPTLMATANAVARLNMIELSWPLCCRSLRAYTKSWRSGAKRIQYDSISLPFFEASYMAGRLASMRGAPEAATNLFKFCLSLNEDDDPKGVMMRLSADLFAAKDYDACLAIFESKKNDRDLIPTVCLCRALVYDSRNQRSLAVEALVDAFAKFPHLLVCLIDACEITTETSSFKDVVWHDHFRKANWTVGQARAYARGGLPRALDVACLRTRHVFKKNVDLILTAAKRLVEQPARVYRDAVDRVDRIWGNPDGGLPGDYSKCPVTDFTDTYEQLGPDAAEGFDQNLLTPSTAQHYRQLREQHPQHPPNGGRGALRHAGRLGAEHSELLDEIIAQLPDGELRTSVLDQLSAGAHPEDVQAYIFRSQLS